MTGIGRRRRRRRRRNFRICESIGHRCDAAQKEINYFEASMSYDVMAPYHFLTCPITSSLHDGLILKVLFLRYKLDEGMA